MITPRPTPNDIFGGRPRSVLTARPQGVPAQPAATASSPDGDPFIPRYTAAVQASGLTHHAKTLALALAGRADWHTGRIPDDAHLGPRALATLTGLGSSAVRNYLGRLQRAGWISRTPAPVVGEPSRIELLIPPEPTPAP